MSEFDRLDLFLEKRKTPEAPEHLATPIIAAAGRKLDRTVTFKTLMRDIFVLPHPQYALTACLVIGLMIGFGISMEREMIFLSDFYGGYDPLSEGAWL